MTTLNTLTTDTAKIEAIRAEMPVLQKYVYLNTGTNGPLPRRSHAALVEYAEQQLTEGRITMAAWQAYGASVEGTRAAFADLLGCAPDEIALTHNTTEGMNIGLLGVDWQPGDELITSWTEHEGGLNPAALLRERFGVKVHYTDIGMPGCDSVAALQACLNPRVKAVALSHVSWSTGAVLPMRELSALAGSVGALVICDAAQSCGMVPANVYDLGVDAYACSGQKWLCGPDGTGALFVRRDSLDRIHQTYTGYFGVKGHVNRADKPFVPYEGAKRYEAATLYPPSVKALGTSLAWLRDEVGWDWAFARIRALAQYAYDRLAALDDVEMFLPRDQVAGLLHFKVAGIEPADLTMKLFERDILIRHTPDPVLNRVATGFYNTEADIDRLAEAMAQVQAEVVGHKTE